MVRELAASVSEERALQVEEMSVWDEPSPVAEPSADPGGWSRVNNWERRR